MILISITAQNSIRVACFNSEVGTYIQASCHIVCLSFTLCLYRPWTRHFSSNLHEADLGAVSSPSCFFNNFILWRLDFDSFSTCYYYDLFVHACSKWKPMLTKQSNLNRDLWIKRVLHHTSCQNLMISFRPHSQLPFEQLELPEFAGLFAVRPTSFLFSNSDKSFTDKFVKAWKCQRLYIHRLWMIEAAILILI